MGGEKGEEAKEKKGKRCSRIRFPRSISSSPDFAGQKREGREGFKKKKSRNGPLIIKFSHRICRKKGGEE